MKVRALKRLRILGQHSVRKDEVIEVDDDVEEIDGQEFYKCRVFSRKGSYTLLDPADFTVVKVAVDPIVEDLKIPAARPAHYANNPNYGRF